MAGLGIRKRCRVCDDFHIDFRCCQRCKLMLPLSAFYQRKSGIHKGYYLSYCKECSTAITILGECPIDKQRKKKERERLKNLLYYNYVKNGRVTQSELLNEEL